jgi:hypothetical protein
VSSTSIKSLFHIYARPAQAGRVYQGDTASRGVFDKDAPDPGSGPREGLIGTWTYIGSWWEFQQIRAKEKALMVIERGDWTPPTGASIEKWKEHADSKLGIELFAVSERYFRIHRLRNEHTFKVRPVK